MTIQDVAHQFANDKQLQAVLVLIALDLILGVAAAVKTRQFQFTKLVGFLQNDVLGKVLPWFALFAFGKFAPSVDVLGLDLNQIQTGVWVLMSAALIASLVSSLADMGLGDKLPGFIVNGEHTGPPAHPKKP